MKNIDELYNQWKKINSNLIEVCKDELKECAKELERLGVLEEGIRGFDPESFNNNEENEEEYSLDEYLNECGVQYTDTDGFTYRGLDFKITSYGEIVFICYVKITGDGYADPEDLEEGYDYYSIDYANNAGITYDLLCEIKRKIERLKESK